VSTLETHLAADDSLLIVLGSTVKDSSVLDVQVFDQRKVDQKNQGFLGVVKVRVSDVLDFELGGHSMCLRSLGIHA